MNERVTVVGEGRMGSVIAATLFRAGFDTTVWKMIGRISCLADHESSRPDTSLISDLALSVIYEAAVWGNL